MEATKTVVTEPAILTASTYFWSSATSASSRRRNEERRQAEVAAFFASLGLNVHRSGDNVIADNDTLHVVFNYNESCKNVYKSLTVERNGKRSNITSLRKLYTA